MIILRQREYGKTSKMIKGALIAVPAGTFIGSHIGGKIGIKKATEEEKKEAAKKKIKQNNGYIEENNKLYPKTKAALEKYKKELGPEKDWDDLDKQEIELWKDELDAIKIQNEDYRQENKELKSGDYSSLDSFDTPTGEKHTMRGAAIGAATGAGIGALSGYGLHKLVKKLKK